MLFVPQQYMTCMVPTVPPMQVPVSAGVAAVPTAVAVLVHGTNEPKSIGSPQSTDMEILGPVEVSNAVWSLYEDQVKPYGRILRKRLAEIAFAKSQTHIEVDPFRLRQACESYTWFSVQDEAAGEWACLLPGLPEAFIDATDPTDVYPPQLWASFCEYLDSLAQGHEARARMPGGRYACARELVARQLPFFAGYTLGQICQIVQLAISQKHCMGYSDGGLVPYAMSQSMVKEKKASQQVPISTRSSRPLAMWPKVREVLKDILHDALLQKEKAVPLSNVKRMFRSQFKVELSETSLGYSKLSELLRDAYLSDLCFVELRQSGYVMIPRPEAFDSNANYEKGFTFETYQESSQRQDVTASSENVTIASPENDFAASHENALSLKRMRPQMMEDFDKNAQADGAVQPGPESNPLASWGWWPLSPSQINEDGCMGGMVQRTFIHHPLPPPTPAKGSGTRSGIGARIRSLSVPKNFGSPKCAFADALHSLVYLHRSVHSAPVSDADDASSKFDSPDIPSLMAVPMGPPQCLQDVDA